MEVALWGLGPQCVGYVLQGEVMAGFVSEEEEFVGDPRLNLERVRALAAEFSTYWSLSSLGPLLLTRPDVTGASRPQSPKVILPLIFISSAQILTCDVNVRHEETVPVPGVEEEVKEDYQEQLKRMLQDMAKEKEKDVEKPLPLMNQVIHLSTSFNKTGSVVCA